MSEKPKIVCARRFPPDVEARAQASYDVWINESDEVLSPEALLELAEGRDALMVSASEKLPGEMIAKLPDCIKAIATFSVGYEHIDIDAAKARGITVTNTPDVLSDCTADIAFLCILGAARRGYEAQSDLRKGEWHGWAPTQYMGTSVSGKRLAIFGMGRIGQAVADRGRGFSMEIHYHNRSRLSPEEEKGAIFHETAESLLGVADFLSINAPSTPETYHFLNKERIELLPQGAIAGPSSTRSNPAALPPPVSTSSKVSLM